MPKKTTREACRLANEEGDQTLCEQENCPWYGDPDGCNHPTRNRDEAPYGNAAAIRSALEDLVYNIEIRSAAYDIFSIVDKKTWLDAKAALKEPPRNCDRFRDELDAQIAFLNEIWLISVDRKTMLEKDKFDNWTDLMKARYASWLLDACGEKVDD